MKGRACTEGSKNNNAMDACWPVITFLIIRDFLIQKESIRKRTHVFTVCSYWKSRSGVLPFYFTRHFRPL